MSRKKPGKPICGAKTRRGTSCQCKPLKPNGRCKFHGGLSTGPNTEDGKEAARRNLEKARATLAGPEHVAARRERSLKGWETRRRQAKRLDYRTQRGSVAFLRLGSRCWSGTSRGYFTACLEHVERARGRYGLGVDG